MYVCAHAHARSHMQCTHLKSFHLLFCLFLYAKNFTTQTHTHTKNKNDQINRTGKKDAKIGGKNHGKVMLRVCDRWEKRANSIEDEENGNFYFAVVCDGALPLLRLLLFSLILSMIRFIASCRFVLYTAKRKLQHVAVAYAERNGWTHTKRIPA